jgi:hypothetical protein
MKKYTYKTPDNKYTITFHRDPQSNTIVLGLVLVNMRGVSVDIDMSLGDLATEELAELIQEIRNTLDKS